MDGGMVANAPETDEILRVLDNHRRKAATYRSTSTWMLMYLPDSNEVFRNTVAAAENLWPEITPFEHCHIADSCWRLASLS